MSTAGGTPRGAPRQRRRPMAAVMVAVFLLGPLLELYVLIQVGQVIGGWSAVGLLLLTALLGGWLVKREGGRAWRALNEALASGRMPARELADAALVLLGGVLMIAPGFVTDLVGLLLVLPLTRPVARTALAGLVTKRLTGGITVPGATGSPYGGTRRGQSDQAPPDGGDVVPGEVVDEPPER